MKMSGINCTKDMIPSYSYVFSLEENFDCFKTKEWLTDNLKYAFLTVTIYVIVIFGGRYIMSKRPRFELRRPLILWNVGLALFSILGFSRTGLELFYVLRKFGYRYTVCVPSQFECDPVFCYWSWLFTLSKIPELGDTIFIVLRKQRLQFLHWYHHITVLLYSWYSFTKFITVARWFGSVNYFVHSLMYSYYALNAMRLKPPKSIAMMITTLQILQMVMGIVLNISAVIFMQNNQSPCFGSNENVTLSLLMYLSYLVLFAKFFREAYLKRGRDKIVEKNHINGRNVHKKLKAN